MALLQLVPSTGESSSEERGIAALARSAKPVSNHEARLARRRRMSMGMRGGVFGLLVALSQRPDPTEG